MEFIRATEGTVPILSQVLSQNSNIDSEQINQLLYSINTHYVTPRPLLEPIATSSPFLNKYSIWFKR